MPRNQRLTQDPVQECFVFLTLFPKESSIGGSFPPERGRR
jgi:hypothetical protein